MEKRIGDWIQTYSGKQIYPLDARKEEIDIIDAAHALSNLCRFTGHCKKFYSVAQHSVLVSEQCPKEHKLWGLLHDLSESVMQDIPRPLKRSGGFEYYLAAEANFMKVVCEKFGLEEQMPSEVKDADNRMLITERNSLMSKPPVPWSDIYEPYEFVIFPWTPEEAEKEFLNTFATLYQQQ